MTDDTYDAIVVGAGLAGLSCAGELVLRGARPLLICETDEVGYLYRSDWVGNNRCLMQFGTRHVAWARGGWWFNLVRDLNLPIKLYPSFNGFQVTLRGSGEMHHLSMCVSPANLTDLIMTVMPIPDEKLRDELERVVAAALAIPHETLLSMHRVTMAEWLEDQKADDIVKMIMTVLTAAILEFPLPLAQHVSIPGMLGILRTYVCGEGDSVVIYPDAREGLCIPIAKAIEQRGGTVWRGRRVAKVVTESGCAGRVVMEDGSEVRAPMVALAYSNGRVASLLDARLPEVDAALAFEAQLDGLQAFETFALLDRPVDKNPLSQQFLIDGDGSGKLVSWSVQEVAPWTVEPGKYLLVSECFLTKEQVQEAGGPEGVYIAQADLTEELHPGYKDAVLDKIRATHPSWALHCTAGPKLPRKSPSIDGLWFVGDGSEPVNGLAMEMAASAGVLGARSMLSNR